MKTQTTCIGRKKRSSTVHANNSDQNEYWCPLVNPPKIRSCALRTIRRKGGSKLRKIQPYMDRIYFPVAVKNVSRVIYQVEASMHYSSLALGDNPVFIGSGSYGEVSLYPKYKVAVKTALEGFRHELLMSLVASECALQAKKLFSEERIITMLAFSIPAKQMVFPAYDMDLSRYCRKLARIEQNERHWASIERVFLGLGRAVVFLNMSCGLTHLDIKCGNIFVTCSNDDSFVLENAVLGDFSLMLFNANSTALNATFLVEVGGTMPYSLRVCRGNVKPMFDIILGHGQTQPCEIMLNALNGDGLLHNTKPLQCDVGLSLDIYALGQCMLELILTAGLCNTYGFGIPRNPHYYYYHRQIRRDYLLDIMAYRCTLYRYIFPDTPLTSRYDVPWERTSSIRLRLHHERYRAAFDAHIERYSKTHLRLFEDIKIPPMLKPLLEVAALFCHSNPKARTATPLLWK